MDEALTKLSTEKDKFWMLHKERKLLGYYLGLEDWHFSSEDLKKMEDEVEVLFSELIGIATAYRDLEDAPKLKKIVTQIRDLEYEMHDFEIMFDMEFDWMKDQRSEFRNWCFRKDKFGRNPLHIAALKGRVNVIDIFLEFCPECMKEVTATRETCLHMAVIHDNTDVLQQLLKWIGERPDFFYLLNLRDFQGNTVLHLSTSRKQLQTLRVLLSCELVDVNALNSGGFTALDILYVLPYSGKIDMEIDMILRQAGAMRSRDLTNQRIKHTDDCCCRGLFNMSSDRRTVKSVSLPRHTLLVIAALIATMTFQAALHLPGSTSSEGYVCNPVTGTIKRNVQDTIIFESFILFNSMAFLASVGMIIFLLHEFPLKPWPQISISSLFGSYVCSIMATSPSEALALLLVSIPFLLLAAAGKHYGHASQSFL